MNDVKLSDKQQEFVRWYVATGGKVGVSSTKAGYATKNEGSRLLRNPSILKAINEDMVNAIGTHAVSALNTVARLSKTARSDYVRLEAAKDLLDRAGFKPPDKQLIKLAGDLSVSFDIAPQTVIEHEGGVEK